VELDFASGRFRHQLIVGRLSVAQSKAMRPSN
jgi:hypothetical protein